MYILNFINEKIYTYFMYALLFLLQECRYRIALPENYTIKFSCDDFGLQVVKFHDFT